MNLIKILLLFLSLIPIYFATNVLQKDNLLIYFINITNGSN